jgi:AcrR family transcriptional regulator
MTIRRNGSVPERARSRSVKFAARRNELADAALVTLGEVGFARASLREIAQKTAFSHGLFHYYFNDKIELITYCVRRYKEHCVTRYDEVVEQSRTARELADGFADLLVVTLQEDTSMHRLWYDLRAQSNYTSNEMRQTVIELDAQLESMIWRVVTAYASLRETVPAVTSMIAYATFDGLFENSLVRHLAGDPEVEQELGTGARWLIGTVVKG